MLIAGHRLLALTLELEILSTGQDKFPVFDSRAPTHPLEQATKLTNICKVESLQQAFLGCLLFQDSICTTHLVSSFDPVTALWEQPGIVLQINSEPDRIKLHKTIQVFRSTRFCLRPLATAVEVAV